MFQRIFAWCTHYFDYADNCFVIFSFALSSPFTKKKKEENKMQQKGSFVSSSSSLPFFICFFFFCFCFLVCFGSKNCMYCGIFLWKKGNFAGVVLRHLFFTFFFTFFPFSFLSVCADEWI